ncbi:MAG: NifB/NifX family molybdenum-iron cluster-binding protein [Nitrospiraceae bacterium]|nr:NifB/NifX family molybdenum-iron cluster-binding protein [Nitrospiraceae bacterium]
MKLCFPVATDEGLDSMVYEHFGSAPAFLVVDAETKEKKTITNNELHHAHGKCSPLKAMGGAQVDAVVVGGIGAGALSWLNTAGIEVYKAFGATVRENLTLFEVHRLPRLDPSHTCAGHGGCAH